MCGFGHFLRSTNCKRLISKLNLQIFTQIMVLKDDSLVPRRRSRCIYREWSPRLTRSQANRIYVSDVYHAMEGRTRLETGNIPRGWAMICSHGLCERASWSQDHGFQNPYLDYFRVPPPHEDVPAGGDWMMPLPRGEVDVSLGQRGSRGVAQDSGFRPLTKTGRRLLGECRRRFLNWALLGLCSLFPFRIILPVS